MIFIIINFQLLDQSNFILTAVVNVDNSYLFSTSQQYLIYYIGVINQKWEWSTQLKVFLSL